jgi:hypothetical protein
MRMLKMCCKATGCHKPPHLGGLCEQHHREDQAKARRRNEAVDLLFQGIVDNDALRTAVLREELDRMQRWWERASRELRSPGTDAVFGNEAEFAIEWCIILAQEMVEAERAARNGNSPTSSQLESTRQWVWERFRNLECGLLSNGVPRH